LRCDVEDTFKIVAKTFILSPSPPEQSFFHDLRTVYEGESADGAGRQLVWLPYLSSQEKSLHGCERRREEAAVRTACKAGRLMEGLIARHAWITEPYEERPDPFASAWEAHTKSA